MKILNMLPLYSVYFLVTSTSKGKKKKLSKFRNLNFPPSFSHAQEKKKKKSTKIAESKLSSPIYIHFPPNQTELKRFL